MYIPYEQISNKIGEFLPEFLAKKFKLWGYELKIRQNLNYIKKNQKNVLTKLRTKIKTDKINVAFYNYDKTKWKSQSLFDLFASSEQFYPYIVVCKNYSDSNNMNYQTQADVDDNYNFFKNKNMPALKGYMDNQYISFDSLEIVPDIVMYSHPWYIYKTQGPVMTSKYALTAYIPYSLPNTTSPIEYYTRFHRYIENFYVLNDYIKDFYSKNMENKGINLKPFGHTMLDYFYLNKNKKFEDKQYVVYAPHWSVDDKNNLRYGTFLEFGEIMLEYAKNHPEFNWVYKPHPCLENYLKSYKTAEEIKQYKTEWQKIGQVYESGDYLDMFMESKVMISDCGSFQTEYFFTKKPFIYLKSKNPTPFNSFVEKINRTYYKAETKDELIKALDEVLVNDNDYKKEERLKLYSNLDIENQYCAEKIMHDFLNMLQNEDKYGK